MVEHRNATALSAFFIEQGPRWCRGVQVVVSDGSKSSNSAIDTHLGSTWADEILAWHDTDRPSNGRIEGTNNLPQILRRVAHGFTNPHNFAARGLLAT